MTNSSSTVVLVLSCTRSGSTWLGYVLGSCPGSAFLGGYYRAWGENLRQPCSWCAANGRKECMVLGGIESVPVDEAFPFALVRTSARVVVDVSKTVEWASAQAGAHIRNLQARREIPYQLRAVHLIRDPRGWYASERRRTPLPLDELMRQWVAGNERISGFLATAGIRSVTAFYDELADDPESGFTALCDALDLPFR